jgi:protocatechuate 3,4-dioxygenase beta subunit
MTSLSRLICFSLILTIAVLLCTSSNTSAQTTDPKPKPVGSISGRAIIGGKGAPGIAVVAYGGDSFNRRAVAQATTDAEGRYRLFGLAAGTYQVAALAPNYAAAEPASPSSFGPNMGLSKNIVMAAAENVEDVDLKLVRGGVITGRVKDAEGKPVVEQQVGLTLVDENGAPAKTQLSMSYNYQMYQTDDRGIYRIYGLPAGHYKVSVGSDSSRGAFSIGSRNYYQQTFFGDVSDQAKATVIELSEGAETGNIDIQVGRRGETYSATGRIVDADSGQPVPGIRYMYGAAPRNQPYFAGGYVGIPTNARGEFRIDGLEPGRYGVSVSANFDSVDVYSDPAFFEVTDGDVSNIEVKATHGLSLSGVVVTDGITNKDVLAQVTLMRISASVASTSTPQTFNSGSSLIAGDGSFTINGLRPGKAGLFLSSFGSPGIKGLAITRVERDGVDVTRALDLKADQPLTNLRVILVYGTGSIRGTVNFQNGTPPSRVFIGARREESSIANYNTQLDSRGRFLISNLPAGTYELTLNILYVASQQQPQRRPPPPKQFVTVADDAEAEVTFTVNLKPGEGGPL